MDDRIINYKPRTKERFVNNKLSKNRAVERIEYA